MKLIKLQRLALQLRKKISDLRGSSGQVYFVHRVDQYRGIWQHVASELGAEFIELAPELWELRKGDMRSRMNNYLLQLDDPVTLNLAGNKPLVHELLRQHDLPVPEHAVFRLDSLAVAERFVAAHPLGSVIKPGDGYGGKGVTTHITERGQVRDAAILASLYGSNLLVEQQVVGECYRLLVFDNQVLSAVRRTGARVTGDGVRSLRQLVDAAQFEVDADCRFTLAAQQLSLSSVPAADQVVLAKCNRDRAGATELRTVYDTDVTGKVHESIVAAALQAARSVGSRFLGVDIITADIARPLREVGGCINEVNTTPALHHHYDSNTQAFPAVAVTILGSLLTPPNGSSS